MSSTHDKTGVTDNGERPTELTFDPENWGTFRALAHRMVDDMLDSLMNLRDQPVWTSPPLSAREALRAAAPWEGVGEARAYEEFLEHILPYTNGSRHPRFYGWVQGNGTPLAMMADMLASGMNAHLAGFDQSPALVEETVIRWFLEWMGFPASGSGLLCSGGSMANLLGLAVARHAHCGFDVRKEGLSGPDRPALRVYGSTETHGWAGKAMELLGLGKAALRLIPTDHEFRISLKSLREAIAEDLGQGLRPMCVLGNAGTVNTGAIDDLEALADLCVENRLWFHIDGAFGALTALAPEETHRLRGVERADSLALDLHKWMYLPFEVACVLVRDAATHKAAFASTAPYLGVADRGVIAGGLPFADRGVELTRGFKALKVWMSLKAYGRKHHAALIVQNLQQAQYLGRRIMESPPLELMAKVTLNIVCWRYAPAGMSDRELDAFNQEIMLRIQESGEAVISSTWLHGRFALRAAIVNHRSRTEDFDRLVALTLAIGEELTDKARKNPDGIR